MFSFSIWYFLVNRKKVDNDYNALQERLSTLPDKLSYNIMVCLVCFFKVVCVLFLVKILCKVQWCVLIVCVLIHKSASWWTVSEVTIRANVCFIWFVLFYNNTLIIVIVDIYLFSFFQIYIITLWHKWHKC